MSNTITKKSQSTTALLALFLGSFGAHRFYLKQNTYGITSILFCWTLVPTIISIFDAIIFARMPSSSFNERFNKICPHCGTLLIQLNKSDFAIGNSLCKDCYKSLANANNDNLEKEDDQNEIKRTAATAPINYELSEDYYLLLKDFSIATVKMANKVSESPTINEHLKSQLGGIPLAPIVTNFIIYDFYQLLKIITNNTFNTSSLEGTGFALSVMDLISNRDEKDSIANKDYNIIAMSHQQGFYKEVASNLVNMGNIKNPIEITIQETADDKGLISNKLKNELCLTTFFKSFQDPLFEEYAVFLYRFAAIISKADNIVTEAEETILKEIFQLINNPIPETKNESLHISQNNENASLEEVLAELDNLIGLNDVKSEITTLVNFMKVQKAREASGLKSTPISYHIVFTGNPGTGKTTVARIVAKIYKYLGVLTEGHLVETDRSGLIAEYSGQTAVKVNKTVDAALNGVLFIDEAYSLVGENKDDYGKEAVATLIKRMEDDRDKLVLILAGYTNEMTTFIDTNPGFESRFNRYVNFPDYTAEELYLIFEAQCKKLEYTLTLEAGIKLKALFENAYFTRDNSFGNGRFARNVFEKTVEEQANRIAREANLTKEVLTTITDTDITVD